MNTNALPTRLTTLAKWMTLGWAACAMLVLIGCDAPRDGSSAADDRPPEEALAEALEDSDPFVRARNLGVLLPTLGSEAIPAVRAALEQFRFDLGAADFELMLRFWALQEPEEAALWTLDRDSPRFQTNAIHTAIEIWAERDPTAAVLTVENVLPSLSDELSRVVLLGLVQGWFKTDRPGLEDYIYSLGFGVKRQRALFAYLLSLAGVEGSEAAIAWAEAIPEDDERYKLAVYRQTASALVWSDMAAAVRFCDAHCDGPFGKGIRNVLVRARLRSGDSGDEVLDWIARVPELNEEQTRNKYHSIWVAYATWAFRDQKAALDWMRDKTSGEHEPWVRKLYGEYARQLARHDPEEAIRWAERIEDESDRELSMVRIARYWLTQDPEAAEAWIEQSPLSETARVRARDTRKPDNLPKPKF